MVLAELTTYLATQGIGTAATDLFYGLVPEEPDALTTLMDAGGLPNEPDMGTPNVRLEFPHVQALTRGAPNDYDGPRLKMQDVITAFTKIANQTISGVSYKAVMAKGPARKLRQDKNLRYEIICEFEVTKSYSLT